MADITMCGSVACPFRNHCRRSASSGTRPNEFRQPYYIGSESWDGDGCAHYWPLVPRKIVHHNEEKPRDRS